MKAIPMIFNTAMVQALWDGRKGQTRRPFTSANIRLFEYAFMAGECSPFISSGELHEFDTDYILQFSPVKRDDLIYVRETFGIVSEEFGEYSEVYKADNGLRPKKWTPSIHMPRELSRITLKVTGVRVERVQDISRNDCIAEGLRGGHGSIPGYMYSATPKEHFCDVWRKIYGDHWERNGWVWVIDFDVILKNVDAVIEELEAA